MKEKFAKQFLLSFSLILSIDTKNADLKKPFDSKLLNIEKKNSLISNDTIDNLVVTGYVDLNSIGSGLTLIGNPNINGSPVEIYSGSAIYIGDQGRSNEIGKYGNIYIGGNKLYLYANNLQVNGGSTPKFLTIDSTGLVSLSRGTSESSFSNLTINNANISNLNSTGISNLNSLNVTNDVNINGDLNVSGTLETGTLILGSALILPLDTNFEVTKDLIVDNKTFLNNDLIVNGNISGNILNISSLNAVSQSNFADVIIEGDFNLNTQGVRNVNISTLGGNINVGFSGSSIINLNAHLLNLNGPINALSDLNFFNNISNENNTFLINQNGDLTTTGELNINGDSVFNNNLSIIGTANLNNINGNNLTLSNNLDSDTASFNSLNVSNSSMFKDINISGDILSNGNLNLNGLSNMIPSGPYYYLILDSNNNTRAITVSPSGSFNNINISGNLSLGNILSSAPTNYQYLILDTDTNIVKMVPVSQPQAFTNISVNGIATFSNLGNPLNLNDISYLVLDNTNNKVCKVSLNPGSTFSNGVNILAGGLNCSGNSTFNNSVSFSDLSSSSIANFNILNVSTELNSSGTTNLLGINNLNGVSNFNNTVNFSSTSNFNSGLNILSGNLSIINGLLNINNGGNLNGNLNINSSNLSFNTNIGSNNSPVFINGDLTTNKNVYLNGTDSIIGGNLTVIGSQSVSGITLLNNTLNVMGTSNLDRTNIVGNTNINTIGTESTRIGLGGGSVNIGSNLSNLYLNGNINFNTNSNSINNINIGNNLSNIYIDGTLNIGSDDSETKILGKLNLGSINKTLNINNSEIYLNNYIAPDNGFCYMVLNSDGSLTALPQFDNPSGSGIFNSIAINGPLNVNGSTLLVGNTFIDGQLGINKNSLSPDYSLDSKFLVINDDNSVSAISGNVLKEKYLSIKLNNGNYYNQYDNKLNNNIVNGEFVINGKLKINEFEITDENIKYLGVTEDGKICKINEIKLDINKNLSSSDLNITEKTFLNGTTNINGDVFINSLENNTGNTFIGLTSGDVKIGNFMGRVILEGATYLNSISDFDKTESRYLLINPDGEIVPSNIFISDEKNKKISSLKIDKELFLDGNAELNGIININGSTNISGDLYLNDLSNDFKPGYKILVRNESDKSVSLITIQNLINSLRRNTNSSRTETDEIFKDIYRGRFDDINQELSEDELMIKEIKEFLKLDESANNLKIIYLLMKKLIEISDEMYQLKNK